MYAAKGQQGGLRAQGSRGEIGRGLWASKQTPTTTQNLNLICQVFTN
jgi:hypothetical protein